MPLWKRPRFWLALMVLGFFVISLYAGIVSYANLDTDNSLDAGIITQAVASTAHGGFAPFYESADCLGKMRCSFLIVHASFVLYAAVPFYLLAPSTVTLFAVRSALVALTAVPLYWLTRQVTGSAGKGLLAAGMFLVWAPSFLGDAFSLHLETILPLELLSLAAVWVAGRYRLGLLVAAVTFVTFEIFPIFTFLLGVFFLVPYLRRGIQKIWDRWQSPQRSPFSLGATFSFVVQMLRDAWRVREVRYIVVLMVSSVAAYAILETFLNAWGYQVLGVISPHAAPGLGGIFRSSAGGPTQSISTILSSPQTGYTAEYWLILYALLAFIPLLSPRALILSVPWIGWTFLTDTSKFSTIGYQYSMIAAAPLFVGLAYGLRQVHLRGPAGTAEPENPPDDQPRRVRRAFSGSWRLPAQRAAWAGALVVVVVVNGLLIPIDPALPALGVTLGTPFAGGYFHQSLEISPSYTWITRLVSTIPQDASVAAPAQLFPLVANLPRAYELLPGGGRLSNLPFHPSGGPQFVLITPGLYGSVDTNEMPSIFDNHSYGLSGYVANTPRGPLFLYEKDYLLTPELFGPGVPPLAATYGPGDGLKPGPVGVEEKNSTSPFGKVISSVDEANPTGLVWTGPDLFFAPGQYTIDLEVVSTWTNLTEHPSAHVLRISVDGFGGTPYNETVSVSSFVSGEWTHLSFNFSLLDPLPSGNVDGTLVNNQFSVAVAAVSVEPQIT